MLAHVDSCVSHRMTAIKVPPLGESIVEATVSRWLKKEGDAVAPGDTLVELETDKITVEVPAMSAGVLTKRAHAEGDVVKVDDLLAEIDESAHGRGQRRRPQRQRAAPAAAAPAQPPQAGRNRRRSPPLRRRPRRERSARVAGRAARRGRQGRRSRRRFRARDAAASSASRT